jgi:hypothetical protein
MGEGEREREGGGDREREKRMGRQVINAFPTMTALPKERMNFLCCTY